MLIESLERRTLMSCAAHTVTLPVDGAAYGNLPDNWVKGWETPIGFYTGAFNAQGIFVVRPASGDELWVRAALTQSDKNPRVWTVTGNYVGGTGRFAGASGAFVHPLYFLDDKGDFVYTIHTQITLVVPCTGADDQPAPDRGATRGAVFNGGRAIEDLLAPASNTATRLLIEAA
jgi:hypothetical protein